MKPTFNPHVFLLDDDPTFNKLVTHVLKKYGVKVESFTTPEEMLARIAAKIPELCIIDLNLGPSRMGWDLIASIRKGLKLSLPILITSTTSEAAAIVHAVEMGANDYLIKPLDKDVLISKLMRFFTTDQLNFYKASSGGVSKSTQIDTTIKLGAQILEIDEGGLTLISRHLINKGTVVYLDNPTLREATGSSKPVLATVSAVTVDPKEQRYAMYLEFDSLSPAVGANVRNWITRQSKIIR